MDFGIQALGAISGAYAWRFENFGDAKAQALELAQEHHVEVIVFQIIGSFKPTTVWTGSVA